MSQTINIDCPFACTEHFDGVRCTLEKSGHCLLTYYNVKSHEYELNDYVACGVKEAVTSWVDERINKSKCAVCMPCVEEEK